MTEREEITFFPYQITGSEWLKDRKAALLADEMGLGKSAQAIRAADLGNCATVLVLCPASLRAQWAAEFTRFSRQNHTFFVVYSGKDEVDPHATVVVCSYDLVSAIPKDRKFDVVIIDEAHFLKSPKAKRTTAVLGAEGVIHQCKKVWALTGTPMPNNASDLWTLMFTFGATPYKFNDFVSRYCTGYRQGYAFRITGTKPTAFTELKANLARYMLRRKKEEVMKDLPPITFQDRLVEPGEIDLAGDLAFAKYTFPIDRRQELFTRVEQERQAVETALARASEKSHGADMTAMKALEGMAQSMATLRRFLGLQKVEPAAAMIADELERNEYEKIVIFAVHQGVLEEMERRLKKFMPALVYGPTSAKTREKLVSKFQNNPKCRVFLGNIQAAGAGLTLTAANHVAFLEMPWSPTDAAQCASRCHRIGQTRPVFVRVFSVADSVDARVSQVLKRKTRDELQLFG